MNITITGNLTVVNGAQKATATFNDAPTVSGSNYVSLAVNVPTGSWTVLGQGTNADFRVGAFSNTDTTSSVEIAINSTASYASILQAGDSCLLTYSGSAVIYAKAVGSHSPALLNYTLASFN